MKERLHFMKNRHPFMKNRHPFMKERYPFKKEHRPCTGKLGAFAGIWVMPPPVGTARARAREGFTGKDPRQNGERKEHK
ncbi:hypothetical protein AGMMS49942_08410 [Spirochaetia bacterium]|nr:hypothetical protein AGMMS49942_08410 [Spirochaetia bacterium]